MVHILFPNNDAVFQDDSLPIHTSSSVKSWFEEHEDALKHLPWPEQSPDLNIMESLLSVLESRVRSRFPPSSLKQLEDVLHEEWYSIPLETIQNIHDSIPRGIQAVLQTVVAELCINKEMCVFHEEWYSIPLETIQNIHDSIPRRIQAVLQTVVAELCINKEMCISH
jgi:hypothetical protein